MQLARFAPPGFVKYEDIASQKPPNPAVEQIIAERRESPEKRFPKLAEQPSERDRPAKRPAEDVKAEIKALADARETLQSDLDAARAAAEADRIEGDLLNARRDALDAQLKIDEASAKAERQDEPPPAPEEK
ncbi:MAG: hypothetical protein ACX939_08400 [Hyphococcus sp.]